MYFGFIQLFLVFLIYSFVGYIMEVIDCSLESKKLVNRGFLLGPICPIYGVGGILIYYLLRGYHDDAIVVFIFGMLITSVIEYFTSYVLEKIFHNKWWDYSHKWDNINGRICLGNAILFGIAAVMVIYFAHPAILTFLHWMPHIVIILVGTILLLLYLADTVYSIIIAFNLRHRIIIVEELKNNKVKTLMDMFESQWKQHAENFRLFPSRLLKAFPDLTKSNYKEFEAMKALEHKEKKKQNKKK